MYRQRGVYHRYRSPHSISSRHVAAVYNQAGEDYVAYADGDPEQLFCFGGLHAYADRHLWSLVERKLDDLRAAGGNSVTILDNPRCWLRARHLATPRRDARAPPRLLQNYRAGLRCRPSASSSCPAVGARSRQTSGREPHVRGSRSPGPAARTGHVRRHYSLSLQRSQPPAGLRPPESRIRARTSDQGAFHHHSALDRQHAYRVRRFDRRSQTIQNSTIVWTGARSSSATNAVLQ
jgi:hypothetical protein